MLIERNMLKKGIKLEIRNSIDTFYKDQNSAVLAKIVALTTNFTGK